MANGNKLIDQKAIDTIIDSILKAVEIKSNKKSSEGRGKDGKDGKDRRDGKNAPQINDDEALSTNPWSGLKTQEEIEKAEGKIYPCSAQDLESMTQEQQAQLFSQGYRVVKTENNGTVVLLGLAADGSLEWLGCNQPRKNWFHNPDFYIAQAGHGGKHGNQPYSADRWWMVPSGVSVSYGDNGITFVNDDGISYAWTSQSLEDGSAIQGKNVTFFVETGSNELLLFSNVYPNSAGDSVTSTIFSNGMRLRLAVSSLGASVCLLVLPSQAGASVTIKYAGLILGSYTLKTLPPWEPPNSAVELLNCKNCFRVIQNNSVFAAIGGASNTQATFFVPTEQKMRVNPSVSPSTGVSMSFRAQTGAYNDTNVTINSVTALGGGLLFSVTGSKQIIPNAFASVNVVLNTAISVSSDI